MSEQTAETPKRGRPLKYSPEMVDKVNRYVDAVMKKQQDGKPALATKEMLSFNLGIDTDTIVEWVKLYTDFSVAIKRLEVIQKHTLMVDGLYGGKAVNSSMGIFLLKANHGMIETQHIDHTTKGKEMPQPILGGSGNVPVDNSTE